MIGATHRFLGISVELLEDRVPLDIDLSHVINPSARVPFIIL